MQFANYSDFRTAVLKMIDGDDVNSQAINQDTLDLLIGLGESRVYYGDGEAGLRAADMEATLALTVTANVATLPADCLALSRVQFTGEKPLDYLPEDDLLRRLDAGGGGASRFYTQQGRTLVFYPVATGTVGGRYYKRPADLNTHVGALHATFNRYPELFLFGALAESAPFLGEDERLPMWKSLFGTWMRRAKLAERFGVADGARLTVKAR